MTARAIGSVKLLALSKISSREVNLHLRFGQNTGWHLIPFLDQGDQGTDFVFAPLTLQTQSGELVAIQLGNQNYLRQINFVPVTGEALSVIPLDPQEFSLPMNRDN